MKPNAYEIKHHILQAILLGNVFNIKAISDLTGHERKTILKYMPQVKEKLLKTFQKGYMEGKK